MNRAVISVLLVLVMAGYVLAVQEISPREGETVFVNVSSRDLNVIKTPFSSVEVYTGSEKLDAKVREGNVFVRFLDQSPEPQEIVIVGDSGDIYPLVLVPAKIPAEVVRLSVKTASRETESSGRKFETGEYIALLKTLVKRMYTGEDLPGWRVETGRRDETEWNEVKKVLIRTYRGPVLTGEVYELQANKDVVLNEQEFYRPGVLAVSIDVHELKAGERTRLYVVRRSDR